MFAADGALTAAMLQKALGREVVFKLICLGGWVRLGGKNWRCTHALAAFSWHPFGNVCACKFCSDGAN